MMDVAAIPDPDARRLPAGQASAGSAISVSATAEMGEVEEFWRGLSASGIESPGQDFDFIRLWAGQIGVPARDRVFLSADWQGTLIALLPLQRIRRGGVDVLTWFPGTHVGCNAPVVDAPRLAAMTPADRKALWTAMAKAAGGADLLYLPQVPALPIYQDLGWPVVVDTLYRAEFGSWEDANTTQRTKSRRKHDRQQGDRLAALGEVSFEEIGNGEGTAAVLDVMFRQRAARFEAMGIENPFACPGVKPFYLAAAAAGSGVAVRLHVLRLDNEIVAVRYNVVQGTRMFCLISSMSDEARIQDGSPGKQCLLRVMQTVFDSGIRSFDMGAGFTDEKRHWCNVRVPVRHHYLPLTAKGHAAALAHLGLQAARRRIKENKTLLSFAKRVRAALHRGRGAEESAE